MKKSIFLLSTFGLALSACGGKNPSPSQAEIQAHFAQYACGVDFTSMGNTDSHPCYRTPEGGAECIEYSHPNATIIPLTWPNGEPVRNVLHVSGGGGKGGGIMLVTTDGKVYEGGVPEVDPTPVVESGGLLVSGGYLNSCALVHQEGKKKVFCQSYPKYIPVAGLPDDFDAVQLTSRWSTSCALGAKGDAWCWAFSAGAAQIPFTAPIKFISDATGEQSGLCGIKFDGSVECLNKNWYPSQSPKDAVRIYDGSYSLIEINSNGKGFYHRREVSAPMDTDGINGITGSLDNIIAMTTQNGDIHILMGDGITQKIPNAKAKAAKCPL